MRRNLYTAFFLVVGLISFLFIQSRIVSSQSSFGARDPGVRGGAPGAGDPIAGLSPNQIAFFQAGQGEFEDEDGLEEGLGPTMNLDSCAGCHSQPAIGGTSPAVNPQFTFPAKIGSSNTIPSFITLHGPVREARFVRNPDGTPDGGVHDLFTVAGMADVQGCGLAQPDFAAALAHRNVIFRIPTPTFGAGLIEQIPDSEILANQGANTAQKRTLGIFGRPNIVLSGSTISGQPNRNGNDGTIARFGWKAQNKSLLLFSGEAYNVEMGITNDLFQTERDETATCQFATTPNSFTDTDAQTIFGMFSSIEKFSLFMRFLAPPAPSLDAPGGRQSIASGRNLFSTIGCELCHTPALQTGNSTIAAFRY